MNNTPTLRTDAVTRTFRDPCGEVIGNKIVSADFARQLERELTESQSWVKASMESAAIASSTISQLTRERDEAKHDIESYRGALGYSIAGTHDGKLTDGTTPQCGMCNSEYRKSIEAERDQLKKVLDGFATYHVFETKTT